MISPDELAALRLTLLRNGYRPVPISGAHLAIKGAGKRPLMKNWETVCNDASEQDVASWGTSYKTSTNTGMLSGAIVGVDIDVLDEVVADKIEALARELLGPTPLKRIGRAPKRLLVFRADAPFSKIQTDECHFPDGQVSRVEILGRGQQFVTYGIHPDTQTDYSWPEQSPANVPASALPLVTAEQCRNLIAKAESIILKAGGESKTHRQRIELDGRARARLKAKEMPPYGLIADALDHVPNDLPYDDWIKIGFALYDGLGEGGRALWEQWSSKSAKNDALLTASKYDSFVGRRSIGVGTLFWYAAQNGWSTKGVRRVKIAGPQAWAAPNRPQIKIMGGELPNIVQQGEDALIASNCGLYQRGGLVVRPAQMAVAVADGRKMMMPVLIPVKVPNLRDILTRVAEWERYDLRAEAWVKKDCPKDIAEAYLAREGQWKLPVLTGLINRPTLRSDGSVLDREGYDRATGLLFDPEGAVFPAVPSAPDRHEALKARDVLLNLIRSFPFVDDTDRSVALSAILTAVIRHSILTAPIHAFTAPVAGSGKSLLVDIASMIATGRPAPVISQGKSDEEMEKRLGSALIAGDQIVSIDNCELPLDGDLLCQVLTQQRLKVRLLGQSKLIEVPTQVAMFATGNNLIITGDLPRRSLLCALDPQCEQPELRQFSDNPLDIIRTDRGQYVLAALTILRAYFVAGRPCRPTALGSFEEWSDWVRGALLWLGHADPCKSMEAIRSTDPKRDAQKTIFEQWHSIIGLGRISVRRLCEVASEQHQTTQASEFKYPALREALLVVSGEGGAINTRRLGKWLGANARRVVEGRKIVRDGTLSGDQQWRLEQVLAPWATAA